MATSELQYYNSFVNNIPDDSTGASVIPGPNSLTQQLNSPNAGRKRKAPDDQIMNDIPHKQPAWQKQAQEAELFCEICNVRLNSLSQTLQHRQGKAHLNKLKKVEEFNTLLPNSTEHDNTNSAPLHPQVNQNPPSVKQISSVNLQCIICQKLFNSESQATQHFQSQKHKQRVQSIGESTTGLITASGDGTHHGIGAPGNGTLPFSSGLLCQPCGLTMNSMLQMNTHLQGSKHKNNVANNQHKSLPLGELRCADCVITFNSQTQMIQHMASPKHMNKVQKKQTTGQFAAPARGRGRGQGRGQGRGRGGASRGGHGHRGRGTAKPPPLASNFIKADAMTSNHGNPFFSPVQSTAITPGFIGGPSFQQPFAY